MRAGPALLVGLLVVLAGCSGGLGPESSPTQTPTATASPTPDPSTVDADGDGLSLALERELGTSDDRANDRAGEINSQLEGDLTDTEKEYLQYVMDNPHNVWPQINESAAYADGDVTTEELRNVSDKDEDGLIRMIELEAGTDPANPDTDGDQLLDGWEYAGGVVINGTYNPLPDADPLHKDLYLLQLPIDGRFPENSTAMTQYIDRYENNSTVTNPDGELGIDIHLEMQEENLEVYRTTDDQQEILDIHDGHPLRSTRYTLLVINTDKTKKGMAFGGGGYILMRPGDPSLPGIDDTIDHETMHSLVGELDEHKQEPDDPFHPNPEYEPLLVTNPDIAEEVSRDGMKGLDSPEEWRLADNSTRSN